MKKIVILCLVSLTILVSFSNNLIAQSDSLIINFITDIPKSLPVSEIIKLEFAISTDVAIINSQNQTNLLSLYPNPFEQSLNIKFNMEEPSDVNIRIFDIIGLEVYHHQLKECEIGEKIIQWEGKNQFGYIVQPGNYLIVIQGRSQVKYKLIQKI
ncbi:MAG: T9SS type A sorting domain-containing protein [Ignavibacteriae bacterium]|nr:T9SS type A sorting domain-containing protein [Ignavibacteriota bacterium]